MAAGIDGGDLEVRVDLFGGFDVGDDGLAVFEFDAAGVGVDDEGRIDEVAMIFYEPVGAVEGATFFIGGEGEDQVAVGLVAFAMQVQEGRDQGAASESFMSWVPRP